MLTTDRLAALAKVREALALCEAASAAHEAWLPNSGGDSYGDRYAALLSARRHLGELAPQIESLLSISGLSAQETENTIAGIAYDSGLALTGMEWSGLGKLIAILSRIHEAIGEAPGSDDESLPDVVRQIITDYRTRVDSLAAHLDAVVGECKRQAEEITALEKRLAELPERLRIELVGLWVDTMPDVRVRDLTVSVKDSLRALLENRRKEKDNERHV